MNHELKYQLAFSMLKNIDITMAEQILARVETEENFFTLRENQLGALFQMPSKFVSDSTRQELLRQADKEEIFIGKNNIDCLYFGNHNYPSRLRNCSDGPVMLYQLGCNVLESRHIVAIVGTRHATHYGVETTRTIVRQLAEKLDDLVIVSGLAYGIDVAAHKAAIECGIPTVAVMAVPLTTIYPSDHRNVAVNIIRHGGALLTEYTTSDTIHKANFLARNRIVAGISDATVVVESDSKGGALFTATIAGEYNREVFAVPGRLSDKYSRGTNALIASNRAHILASVDELIEIMNWTPKPVEGEQQALKLELTESEQKIHDYLSDNPGARVNDIMTATGIHPGQIKDLLFTLEMKDLVASLPGGCYTAVQI